MALPEPPAGNPRPRVPKFVQITGARGKLYALDLDGRVWVYTAAMPKKDPVAAATLSRGSGWAYWTRLTDHRSSTSFKAVDGGKK